MIIKVAISSLVVYLNVVSILIQVGLSTRRYWITTKIMLDILNYEI